VVCEANHLLIYVGFREQSSLKLIYVGFREQSSLKLIYVGFREQRSLKGRPPHTELLKAISPLKIII